MNENLLARYSISKSGSALSDLIVSRIISEVDVNKLSCCCPISKDYLTMMSRQTGYASNKAIEAGIRDYMINYSRIDLKSVGTAVLTLPIPFGNPATFAVPANIAVSTKSLIPDNKYDLDHNGILSFSDNVIMNNLFTTYSTGRLLGINKNGELLGIDVPVASYDNITAGVKSLFDDIVSWLSTNNIPEIGTSVININSTTFKNEITSTSVGTVYFNGQSQIDDILKKVQGNLFKLNTDNMAYTLKNNVTMPDYFGLVWGIISTGLVEYMNINYTITYDAGFGVVETSLYTYTGTSSIDFDGNKSKIVFGDKFLQRVNVIIDTNLPVPIDAFRIVRMSEIFEVSDNIFKFYGRDVNGMKKEFVIPIIFPQMDFSFSNGMVGFIDQVSEISAKLYENIEKTLINIGYTSGYIEEILIGVKDKLNTVADGVISGMNAVYDKAYNRFQGLYLTTQTRIQRKIQWDIISTYPPIISVKAAKESIFNFTSQIKGGLTTAYSYAQQVLNIQNYAEIVGVINAKISQINVVKDKMLTIPSMLIDFGIVIKQIGLDKMNNMIKSISDGAVLKVNNNMPTFTSNVKLKTKNLTDTIIHNADSAKVRVEANVRSKFPVVTVDIDNKINHAMKQLDDANVFTTISSKATSVANRINVDVNNNLNGIGGKITKAITDKFATIKIKNIATKTLDIRKNFIDPFLQCPIPKEIQSVYDTVMNDITDIGVNTVSDTILKDLDNTMIDSVDTEVNISNNIINDVVYDLSENVAEAVSDPIDTTCSDVCNCSCKGVSLSLNKFNLNIGRL